MLKKGIEEGRWTEKFVSRVQFSGDLVTASPDVYQASLGADSEFLVLASDGLWDYINSSDAVSFVRNQLRQHGDVQLACDALAEAALWERRKAAYPRKIWMWSEISGQNLWSRHICKHCAWYMGTYIFF